MQQTNNGFNHDQYSQILKVASKVFNMHRGKRKKKIEVIRYIKRTATDVHFDLSSLILINCCVRKLPSLKRRTI